MLINGLFHTTFGAVSCDFDVQPAEIINYDDWLRQGSLPIIVGKKEYYKVIKLTFLFRGTTKQMVIENISNLVAALEHCTLQPNKTNFYYDCTVVSTNITKYNGIQQVLEVELKSSYAYLPAVTVTLSGTTQTITVPGNLPTPAVVTLTPSIDLGLVTLTGTGKPITISNLHANTPAIIDGEQCLVTESGTNKFSDTDMWAFPVLQPGANTISIDHSGVTVQIAYKPKFI